MSLKTYLKDLSLEEREAFAKACETTVGQLNQVAGGFRRAGESLAINVERESRGKVTCEQLRPDVDWAYLRNTKPKKRKAA
jgi:DNA-binding transcriptional regulator YdaS (Cro superfamily)